MKLTFYFPFFLLVFLAVFTSCNRDEKVMFGTEANRDADVKTGYNQLQHADTLRSNGVYDSAYVYYNRSKQLFEKHNDSLYVVYCLLHMAQIQQNTGDYFGCEATATEALPFLSERDTLPYREMLYNLLGRSNRKLFNYKSAIYYYKKSIAVSKDSLSECMFYNNIASAYADEKKYDQALLLLEKLNRSNIVAQHKETKARVLSNLGHVYFKLNRPEAEEYLIKGYAMRKQDNDQHGLIASYLELSEFYAQSNSSLFKAYAQKAYSLAHSINSQDDRLFALRLLVNASIGQEQLQKTQLYFSLSDSLDKVKMMAKSEFAKIKYDAKVIEERLKEEEIKHQLASEESSNRIRFIILAALVIVAAIGTLFYIKRLKYRKEKLLQVYATETRISKRIHDELANDVFKVMSFAEAQDFTLAEHQQKLIKNLDSIYTKTRDISRENNSIDTGENFAAGLREMLADYKTKAINVMLVNYNGVVWSNFSEPKKITAYRVLQELMVNMKKHSQASMVVIKFAVEGKKTIITYSDNGRGLDNNKVIYKNGLQNAETRMKSVNGYITFENEPGKGLKATMEFTL